MTSAKQPPATPSWPDDVLHFLEYELFDYRPWQDVDYALKIYHPRYAKIVADSTITKAVARLHKRYPYNEIAQFIAHAIHLPELCVSELSDRSSLQKEFRPLHKAAERFNSVLKQHRLQVIMIFAEQPDQEEPLSLAKGNATYNSLRSQISTLAVESSHYLSSASSKSLERAVRTKQTKASLRNLYVRQLATLANSQFKNQQRTIIARLAEICLNLDQRIDDATMTSILRKPRPAAQSLKSTAKNSPHSPAKRDQTLGGW